MKRPRRPSDHPLADRGAVAVMAKAPKSGWVKTRLRGFLPDGRRVALYEKLLTNTVETLRNMPQVDLFITYAPEGGGEEYFDRFGLPTFAQEGKDLGQRMHNALCHLLGMGYGEAALVGSDVPGITPGVVNGALGLLQRVDVVFGPAEDGGYYLVALSEPIPELFRGVPWSSEYTLEVSLRLANALGLSVGQMHKLWDVDTPQDVKRYHQEYGT